MVTPVLPSANSEAPAIVPTRMASIIGQRRRVTAPTPGPAASCQILVTSDGTISRPAAASGEISPPNIPIATVGKPMPVTPLTKPATHEGRGNRRHQNDLVIHRVPCLHAPA